MGDLNYARQTRLGVIPVAQADEFARCFDICLSRRPFLQPLNNGAAEAAVLVPAYWPRVEIQRMKVFLQAWLYANAYAAVERSRATHS